MKRTTRILSDDQVRRAAALIGAGMAPGRVAAELGVSSTAVSNRFPTAKSAPADPEVVRRLRAGERQYAVVHATGRSQGYVSRVALRLKLGTLTEVPTAPTPDEAAVADSISADGIRTRIVKALAGGMVRDTFVLIDLLRHDGGAGNIQQHEVQHCLQSLQQQGQVAFGHQRHGTNQKLLVDIRLTTNGRRANGLDVEKSGPVVHLRPPTPPTPLKPLAPAAVTGRSAELPAIAAPEPVAPAPVEPMYVDPYPLLYALQGRKDRALRRAMLLSSAAALTDDEAEREDLELKSMLAREVTYTDLEAEYLKFAEREARDG